MNLFSLSNKAKCGLAFALCISAFLLHFSAIVKYAVNVPYWDEWEAFQPTGLLANPSFSQFFAQHNEHRILTTKILTYLLYEFDGWNIATHQIINFVIYGLTVFFLVYVVRKSTPQLPAWILLCFTVFLFTTVNWENHFWGFQTQFHFSLLFLFLSVWFLFKENQTWSNLIAGVFFTFLLVYSLSGGLVESIALVGIFVLYKALRINKSGNKKLELFQLVVVAGLICIIISSYFIGYVKPINHPPYTFPYEKKFWVYFLNLLSGGFGYKVANILPGSLIFLFTLIPVIGNVYKKRGELENQTWILITLTLCIYASLVSIVIGRAQFGTGHSKAPRYAEVIFMLIPLSIALWSIFLEYNVKFRRYLLTVFWLFCFGSFFSYWNFWKLYRNEGNQRLQGIECIKNYYTNGGDGNCQTIYPHPIPERLEFNKNSDQSSFKSIRNSINP